MAYDHQWVPDLTLVAAADLSALQFTFVKLDNTGKAAACTGATDKPIGILQNKPTSGGIATVRVIGVSKVLAESTLDEGQTVGVGGTVGRAEPKVVATDSAEYSVGQVLTAGAAGEIVTVVINCAAPARAS